MIGIERHLVPVAFVVLAVAATRFWLRHRTEATGWLAAAASGLATMWVVRRAIPTQATGALEVIRDLAFLPFLAFPYLLFRFTVSFSPVSTRVHWWMGGVTVAILGASALLLPALSVDGRPARGVLAVYVIALLVYWTALSTFVVVRLWRSGAGQSTVARRRMRLLAVGAVLLCLALLAAGAVIVAGAPQVWIPLVRGGLVLVPIVFLLGFTPPRLLRELWRRPDEDALQRAETDLLRAASPPEVATTLLPHLSNVLGGSGAALLDRDGGVIGTHGLTSQQVAALLGLHEPRAEPGELERVGRDRLRLPLRAGALLVQTRPSAPFVGLDEAALLRRFGALVDLALAHLERVQGEQEARQALQLASAELEAIVYGISHDLRSPLVSVLGYLDYLKADCGDALGEEGDHYVRRMSAAVVYMEALISDLLELFRIGRTATTSEDVDLGRLAEELCAELSPRHPRAHLVVSSLPVVEMSPVRARQLLSNLVENALRHGGRPDLSVEVSSDVLEDGGVCVCVHDDGVGVPHDYRERVFGLFERLAGSSGAGGTGLGLAMCDKIVGALGGRIWIADSDSGTDVRVAFPPELVRAAADRTAVTR